MHREQALQVEDWYYGKFIVDQEDIIMRHQPPEYDHLRLHLYEEVGGLSIKLLFMESNSLDILASHGIAEAYLDQPTQTTEKVYTEDQISRWERENEWQE